MVHSLVAVVLVVVGGLPLAFALTRSLLLTPLLAPLVTALTCAAAVMAMLAVGGGLRPWLAVAFAGQYAVAFLLWRRGCEPWPHRSWADVAWIVVPLLPPFLRVFAAPIQWDAHSIWWLHAVYFTKGSAASRHYITDPVYVMFSHTDYPPLASAPVAAVWSMLHGYQFYVAQFTSSVVTFSAIALLSYAVRTVTARTSATVSRAAGACVALATWGAAPFAVSGGLSDPLWTAAWVAAAVLLLLREDALARPTLPLLLMSLAALTKNEALVMVVVLAAMVTLRERRNLRRAALVWLPVAVGLVWVGLARILGARSDVTADARYRDLLGGDPEVWNRFPPIVSELWTRVGPIVAFAVVVAVLGGLFLRRRRPELGLGSDLWLWGLGLIYFASLAVTYLASTRPIWWYLWSSVIRVSLPLALLSCASAVCWGVVALHRSRRRPAGSPALSPAEPLASLDPAGRP
ncbi:MAG: hypothetical protein JWO57_952 [Pseudonocardiales bacterium]|nr:hypothetical protein [Pseudonocardiales bacterium]